MPGAETDIATIAASLKDARDQHKHVTLFLGSRAGVLYSEDNLYKALVRHISTTNDIPRLLKQLAPSNEDFLHLLESRLHTLDNLSSTPEKFEECYSILKQFSESGIHTILVNALAPIRYREEDELMAGLIKAGFFDSIITTNIDTLLEDACEALWNIRQPDDYRVIRCGIDGSEGIEQGETKYGRVIKVFGDLSYLMYKTASNEFDLEADQALKEVLCSELSEEVLMIGYDPTWDRPMEQAFQEARKALWYINEELPPSYTHLTHVLEQRGGGHLVGTQGNYSNFVRALYGNTGGNMSREIEALSSLPLSQSQKHSKKRVFISYSHENREYLDQLKTHLKRYIKTKDEKNILDIWDDARIPSGANWKEEIAKSLESARIVILLISADFFASDFIHEYELPALLEAAQAGEIRLLSVLLGPCAFTRTPLYQYQAVNSISQPLMGMTPYEQDVVWAKLAELVHENLSL